MPTAPSPRWFGSRNPAGASASSFAPPIWRYREDYVLSLLSPEELPVWREARAKAQQDGLLMMAHPLHCAVGRKPAG